MFTTVKLKCASLWAMVRRLSGDDAYEQYLKHYAEAHGATEDNGEKPPLLTREEFFKQWQDGKWKGVKRCC